MTPSGFDSNEYFASPGKRQLSDLARRINSDGYEFVVLRPRGKQGRKQIPVHILIAEKALGKPLPTGSIVHHADGNKLNNSRDNLAILQSNSEHSKLHARQNAMKRKALEI